MLCAPAGGKPCPLCTANAWKRVDYCAAIRTGERRPWRRIVTVSAIARCSCSRSGREVGIASPAATFISTSNWSSSCRLGEAVADLTDPEPRHVALGARIGRSDRHRPLAGTALAGQDRTPQPADAAIGGEVAGLGHAPQPFLDAAQHHQLVDVHQVVGVQDADDSRSARHCRRCRCWRASCAGPIAG